MKSRFSKKLICLIMALAIMASTSFVAVLVSNAYTPTSPTTVSGLWPNGETTAFSFNSKALKTGYSESYVLQAYGNPDRQDPSEYGFTWYIYKFNNQKYLQVGIQNGTVVAFYSNYTYFRYYRYSQELEEIDQMINVGVSKSTVRSYLGTPLTSILKGNTYYQLSGTDEMDVFLINNTYFTVFYDVHNNDTVTAMQVVDKATEEAFQAYYASPSSALTTSYEQQVFDITNAVRVRNGQTPYVWNGTAANIARAHSQDMGVNNFFSHTSSNGQSFSARLTSGGISWWSCAENIAAGQQNAIFAVEGWMNSLGHRNNILGNCSNLGVGVYMGGNYGIYYTQDFYTPR